MQILGFPIELWLLWLASAAVYVVVMVKLARKPKEVKSEAKQTIKITARKPKTNKDSGDKKPVQSKLSDKEKKKILEKLKKLSKFPLVEEKEKQA